MTDSQFRVAIKAVELRTGSHLVAAPKIITESGRPAQLGSSDGDNGVWFDVLATVGPDGFSIATKATPAFEAGGQTWRIVSATTKLWDGQTMVIGGQMSNQPAGPRKLRMVFITPRIIDPLGNPVHTDEELSKRPGIPPQ
jgi:type II secretory pathway component GspD/PulD (secretin)